MRCGRASARGFKNHDPPARLVAPWKQALHARRSRAEFRTYFYPHPLRAVGMPTLEVRGLSKSIDGHPVLKDVTFGLQDGELAAILGPSGGGKTTLFRCILGELTPEAGEIFIDGQEVGQLPTERRGIGVVYQSFALFPHLSVADNIGYGLRARRVPADTASERISEMLDLVHLQGKENRFPRELSGGERQRVALARALCVGPKILLLDEAFGSLDATMRTQVVQEVRSIIRRQKVTTLFITHDQEEAFMFARRMIVLNDGRVVASGSPETMMKHSDPFIQDFMKMVLFADAIVQMGPDGAPYITLDGGAKIPVHIPDVRGGEKVHVMVKKGAEAERIEVWQRDAK
ncbi:MAG: ABC transporter ATP-binding protein [Methanobacteriota archaeon]|nr:MAG: ABC transporter ATP-binding protein [Euryarchaeota archaeon]